MPATTPVYSTFGAFEFDENDGLLRPEEIGHYAQHLQIEFFDLVAGENGVGIALHACANLLQGDDFGGLLSLGWLGKRAQENGGE